MVDVMLGMFLATLVVGTALFNKVSVERATQQAYRKGFEDGANTVLERTYLKLKENEKD